jgi:hypothetical protein
MEKNERDRLEQLKKIYDKKRRHFSEISAEYTSVKRKKYVLELELQGIEYEMELIKQGQLLFPPLKRA